MSSGELLRVAGAAEPVPTAPEAAGLLEDDVPDAQLTVASQWRLMWWRFRKHKLAIACGIVLALFYIVAIFAEVIAPYDPSELHGQFKFQQPNGVTFTDANGDFVLWPGVRQLTGHRDPNTLRITYVPDENTWQPLQLFAHGEPYKLWGIIPGDIHLIGLPGPTQDQALFLLGTDRLGRDLFSRIIYGSRISLSIGIVGVVMSFVLGILLGGLSGYYGGWVDLVIQRLIELIRSMPQVPLFLAFAAAVPAQWPVEYTYLALVVILSFINWTGLARAVRGRFLSLREEDFVLAARLSGASQKRIMFRHMLPSFTSHIIASLTLAIPNTIIAETTISFLGLGMREPGISWGLLLQDAQNLQNMALYPWLLLPAIPLIVVIVAFNFLGDGLRDAADPYGR